ncbi:MAG TPA: 50S ribosomal protein L25 [Anaerolineales bacterium]
MEKFVLKASKRDISGKQVKALRRSGLLPAVIYGRHVEPLNISLDAHSASLILAKMTSSSLVTIELDGNEYPALVREKQRNFVKDNLLHVDFLAVNLTENIRTNVRVEITGISPAVKDLNAVLVTNITTLEVECLPTDLPERFLVDISSLKQVGDGIRVGDLAVSDKVRVLTDKDEMIVVTTFAKQEVEEVAPAVEGAAVAEPEVIEKGKKEEEGEEE